MKQRIISSVVGIGILVAVLCFFNTIILNIAISVICIMAIYEFLTATGICKNKLLSAVSYLVAFVIPLIPLQKELRILPIFLLPYIFILFCILLKTHQTTRAEHIGLVFIMSLGIPLSLSTAAYIRDRYTMVIGVFYVILALGGAWLSDSGAYFAGRAFGKRKLCPLISPNKTVEGAIGGMITCVLLYGFLGFLFEAICGVFGIFVEVQYIYLLLIAPFASIMSVLGDLSFSIMKRQFKIKDFGNIMPGHGGVLDRFDSVLFVAPFVCVATWILPICIVV